jgi:KaiC/GvpD/RAD55 family RecA-like ATPase
MTLLERASNIQPKKQSSVLMTFENAHQVREELSELPGATIMDVPRSSLTTLLQDGTVIAGKSNLAHQPITTGTAGLDALRPIAKNSVTLIAGTPGSGKTLLAIQFLLEGLQKKEHCTYITFEERKESFYKYLLQFGWDMAAFEQQGLFTFLRYPPESVKQFVEDAPKLGQHVKRVVIDSLTAFAVLQPDELTMRESVTSVLDAVKKWQSTTIITANLATAPGRGLALSADSTLILTSARTKNVRHRTALINNQPYGIKIDKDGLTIEPPLS